MYRCMDDSSTLVADATNEFILLLVFFVCIAVAVVVSCRVVSCRSKRKTEIRRNEKVYHRTSEESTLVHMYEARVNSTLVCTSPISLSILSSERMMMMK